MATNTKQKKSGFSKFLLWAVVILVGLHLMTDGESTQTILGYLRGEDTSQTQPAETTEPPPTAIQDAQRLPSVPEALYGHVYLASRGRGACASFTGNVKMLVVFVNDPGAVWTEAEMEEARQDIALTIDRIRTDAQAYGADLTLTADYRTANASMELVRKDYRPWVESALTDLGLPTAANETCLALEEQYGADEVPIVFCTNREGRSFANAYSGGSTGSEYALIYGDTVELYHEVCHIFGAEDFYFPKEVADLADTHLPNSLMADSAEGVMEGLTAYSIGWTDQVSESAMTFLEKTAHLTQAYLTAQKLLDNQTGYVENHSMAGGTYTGYLVDGVRHGQGTLNWGDGNVYSGNWEHGLRHGQGRMTFAGGDVYDGQWNNGNRHGTGTYTWTSGNRYVGEFVENMRQGQGTMYYAEGGQYTGQWADNERNGQGKLTYAEGHTYEGSWKNGTFNGQGVFTWTSGDKYVGDFVDGNRQGYGIYYYPNGSRYEGQWFGGECHGQGTMYYPDGTQRSGKWDNGSFVG